MKPSDRPAPTGKPIKTSTRADPPISEAEARAGGVANCPRHNGLVLMSGETEGAVFFCPKGSMYWRYSKKKRMQALRYRPLGVV